jgi:hypothetical protein
MPARRGDGQLAADWLGLLGASGPGLLGASGPGLLAGASAGIRGQGPLGVQHRAHGESEVRLIRPDPDYDLTANPVRAADPADDNPHGGQRTSLASSRSMRT